MMCYRFKSKTNSLFTYFLWCFKFFSYIVLCSRCLLCIIFNSGVGNHVRSMSSQDGNSEILSEKRTPPTPRISEVMLRTKGDVNRASSNRGSVNSEIVTELDEHMDRIRKYQVSGLCFINGL